MTEKNPQAQLRRSRAVIVVVLILSLLASAATRYWSDEQREAAIPHRGESTAAGTSFSSMNSFALGLLLGGLRGPLVMILWTESESQKSERNLEGLDTQIEWIRLLQPEFDTVHIFQIWNKAYNLSVQMATLSNKYSVILDALDYAHSVDREKPEDINIIAAMAQTYFDKLGGSTEKLYYRRRVRRETLPHAVNNKRRNDPGWRRTELDPLLDDQFMILPQYLKPAQGRERPSNLPPDAEWNDGSELQYLARFQPFPDGVSPLALAYNYFKRAEVLQNVGNQKHAQLSDLVIDSRPALSLKVWLEEEWEQGRRREGQAFGLPVPEDRAALEPLTAGLMPDHPVADRADANLAVFAYDRGAKLGSAATAEYIRHISNNPANFDIYKSHMDEINAEAELVAADRDYLSAQLASPSDRPALLASAKAHYQQTIYFYDLLILRYFVDPRILESHLPPGFARFKTVDRKGIEELPKDQLQSMADAVEHALSQPGVRDSHMEDIQDYRPYMDRARTRLEILH